MKKFIAKTIRNPYILLVAGFIAGFEHLIFACIVLIILLICFPSES